MDELSMGGCSLCEVGAFVEGAEVSPLSIRQEARQECDSSNFLELLLLHHRHFSWLVGLSHVNFLLGCLHYTLQ